jgi:hypothetical protein
LVRSGSRNDMRIAALLFALFTILVGIVGLVSPDSETTVRRLYFATSVGLYAAAAVRVAMGLVLILCAPISRAPRTLRALGVVVCMQGLAAMFLGLDRARATFRRKAASHARTRGGTRQQSDRGLGPSGRNWRRTLPSMVYRNSSMTSDQQRCACVRFGVGHGLRGVY